MNWLVAAVALVLALVLPGLVALRAGSGRRLIATQLATVIAAQAMVALSFASGQSSFIDLPLTLVLLSLPGSLVLVMFLERWL
jgi:multicomponent Na+:H+ antiporter subunit F